MYPPLKDHPLANVWAYRYDSEGSGVRTHCGNATITVNFWITPDESNINPSSGMTLDTCEQLHKFVKQFLFRFPFPEPNANHQCFCCIQWAYEISIWSLTNFLGGLIIFKKEHPPTWDFNHVNKTKDLPSTIDMISDYLGPNPEAVNIPYKCNR